MDRRRFASRLGGIVGAAVTGLGFGRASADDRRWLMQVQARNPFSEHKHLNETQILRSAGSRPLPEITELLQRDHCIEVTDDRGEVAYVVPGGGVGGGERDLFATDNRKDRAEAMTFDVAEAFVRRYSPLVQHPPWTLRAVPISCRTAT